MKVQNTNLDNYQDKYLKIKIIIFLIKYVWFNEFNWLN